RSLHLPHSLPTRRSSDLRLTPSFCSTPNSLNHVFSCSPELKYTIGPKPTHPCAAAHIGQCSPVVYIVVSLHSSIDRLSAAQYANFISGCAKRFFSLIRFLASANPSPSLLTKREPNASSPDLTASSAKDKHLFRYFISSFFIIIIFLKILNLIIQKLGLFKR